MAVLIDGKLAGAIAVTTPVRPEAAGALAHLREFGLRTVLLSGDGQPAVDAVAGELGIDDARHSLSPQAKLDVLRDLQSSGRRVVMVGDGINDAPALAAADVGCAIGSGTEAALANSEVALLGNDLEGVPAAIAMARATLAVIYQNFGWAMGYNISAVPLAAAGLLDPLVAAIAMGLSSIIVVLNSLRLMRLGRAGLGEIRPPRFMVGVRGMALSIAVPIVLFAAITVAGQVVSPARGQSLLPTLPSIVTIGLPHQGSAEFYLDPGSPGVNSVHTVFSSASGNVSVRAIHVSAARATGPAVAVREVLLSPGHFIGYALLAAGTWHFRVTAVLDDHPVAFSVTRSIG